MDSQIIVATLALLGTTFGTAGGIFISSKLTNYRIEQLEKKVDKHNTVVERTFALEKDFANMRDDIKDIKESM